MINRSIMINELNKINDGKINGKYNLLTFYNVFEALNLARQYNRINRVDILYLNFIQLLLVARSVNMFEEPLLLNKIKDSIYKRHLVYNPNIKEYLTYLYNDPITEDINYYKTDLINTYQYLLSRNVLSIEDLEHKSIKNQYVFNI